MTRREILAMAGSAPAWLSAVSPLAEAQQKTLTIRTSVLAKRLLVEISFSAPGEWRNAEETAAVLGLTQSVVAGHGGEAGRGCAGPRGCPSP